MCQFSVNDTESYQHLEREQVSALFFKVLDLIFIRYQKSPFTIQSYWFITSHSFQKDIQR